MMFLFVGCLSSDIEEIKKDALYFSKWGTDAVCSHDIIHTYRKSGVLPHVDQFVVVKDPSQEVGVVFIPARYFEDFNKFICEAAYSGKVPERTLRYIYKMDYNQWDLLSEFNEWHIRKSLIEQSVIPLYHGLIWEASTEDLGIDILSEEDEDE